MKTARPRRRPGCRSRAGLRCWRVLGGQHRVRDVPARCADGLRYELAHSRKSIANVLYANPNDNNFAHQKARQSVNTDWLGIAVHCAQGSPLCSGPNGAPDLLPDEPGGYTGFNALYGNINVAPVICVQATKKNSAACDANNASGHVRDVFGTTVIADGFGRPGFPNIFSPTAAQSLGYASAMLEAGLQVVYLYVADAHDRNPLPVDPNTGRAAPLTRSVQASRNMSTSLRPMIRPSVVLRAACTRRHHQGQHAVFGRPR